MTAWEGPTLFCFDGSDGSRAALGAAGRRLRPGAAVVLTVWETVALRVASQAFSVAMPVDNEADLDASEEAAARAAADEARASGARARGMSSLAWPLPRRRSGVQSSRSPTRSTRAWWSAARAA